MSKQVTSFNSRVSPTKCGKIFLVDGKRIPFGSFGGPLKDLSPIELAHIPAQGLINKLKLSPASIDHVLFANVLPTTTDTLYAARHLALKLDLPIKTPGYSVNRLCGSGIEVLSQAYMQIALGKSQAVLCAGAENMSNVPHLIYGSRWGFKFGGLKTVDLLSDSLTDKYCKTPMGITAENLAEQYKISRSEVEEYVLECHRRAVSAYAGNLMQEELIEVPVGKVTLTKDEGIRENAKIEDMTKLKPSFKEGGVVTPATASAIVDGGVACLVASEKYVEKYGIKPKAEIIDFEVVGVEPTIMGIGPVPAIQNLLKNNELKIEDVDLYEINEAFGSQVLACQKELKISLDRLNIWGGAIAIGHPLGATGLRITNTLVNQLIKNKKELGISSACIGGGQGIAILVRVI